MFRLTDLHEYPHNGSMTTSSTAHEQVAFIQPGDVVLVGTTLGEQTVKAVVPVKGRNGFCRVDFASGEHVTAAYSGTFQLVRRADGT